MQRDILRLAHPALGALGVLVPLRVFVETIGIDTVWLQRTKLASIVMPALMLDTWMGRADLRWR